MAADSKSADKLKESVEVKPAEPRFVEVEQDEKAVAIANRVNLTSPYTVLVMNEYGARMHRHDFVAQIVRQLYDWFQANPKAQKQIE